jgi:cyclohexyl-isocyanide hydratase
MADLLQPGDPLRVAMLLFPGVTQLDLTGPHEVFTRVRGVCVETVWKQAGPVRTGSGLTLLAERGFDEVSSADLLCIPGGPGHIELLGDPVVLDWVRRVAADARWVTSVCTGALVLGAAGLLRGHRATTYWAALPNLAPFGAIPVAERVVFDGNRVTGGGVTSGIDFALQIVARLYGPEVAQLTQLSLEYDPQPPFASGSPTTAPPALVARLTAAMAAYQARSAAAVRAAAERL